MESRIEKFTRGFFWAGYVVFLSASIPHVAAYFRHFDPVTPNQFQDVAYWMIAVAIAVVIDVSDVLVSIAVIRAKANGATRKDTFLFWVFIFLIMGLSWFFNWQYNVVFGTSQFHTVDSYSIMNRVTIGQINPVIGSAFQLLILVYTLMAHKFSQKPKTAAELVAEAERLESLESAQKRIDAYKERNKKASIIQRAKGTITELKDAVNELKNGTDEEVSAELEVEVESSPEMEVTEELEVEVVEEVPAQEIDVEDGTDEEADTDPEVEAFNVVPFRQNGSADFPKTSIKERLGRKKLFTIAQAAEELQCSQRYVRELRKKGTLATDESGLITSASLKAYKKKRTSRLEA